MTTRTLSTCAWALTVLSQNHRPVLMNLLREAERRSPHDWEQTEVRKIYQCILALQIERNQEPGAFGALEKSAKKQWSKQLKHSRISKVHKEVGNALFTRGYDPIRVSYTYSCISCYHAGFTAHIMNLECNRNM